MTIGARDIVIVVLLVAITWLTIALVRVENQRYMMSIGGCPNQLGNGLPPNLDCVRNAQTRTHWWWHVYYALTDE